MANSSRSKDQSGSFLKRWLKEPLLQFLALGTLIFVVDGLLGEDINDPKLIIVDDNKLLELVAIFENGQGRPPTSNELENLIITYTQNEVLFREGQQLKLHEGDEMIRSRLVLKMRNILLNKVVSEEPAEAELVQWFEDNRDFYNAKARVTLEMTRRDLTSETEALATAQRLNSGDARETEPDDCRVFPRRPENTLTAFVDVLSIPVILEAEENQWVAIQTPAAAWRIARITERLATDDADFKQMRAKVLKDWLRISKDKQLARQTKAIIDQYDIVIEPSDELLEQYQVAEPRSDSAQTDRLASNHEAQEG